MTGPSRDYMEQIRAANRRALGMGALPADERQSEGRVVLVGLGLGLLAWWLLSAR